MCHMRSHTGEDTFKCDVSKFSAALKSTLVHHMSAQKGESSILV